MLRKQITFFFINGIVSLVIAYGVYYCLIVYVKSSVVISNIFAYLIGMVYGFFGNRKLSFNDETALTGIKIMKYFILYGFTLYLNVIINRTLLLLNEGIWGGLFLAFLGAILVSTFVNFIGMKYWVFKLERY